MPANTAKNIEAILREKKIYQILRPKCIWASPTISLKEAIKLMHREKCGYLVICDEHLKVVGIFTERNVLMQVLKDRVSLKDPVSKYMRANPVTLKKTDTVGDAIHVMHDHNMRHIPLVDDLGQLVGVLSARTVITFLAELFPTEVFNLPPRAQQTFETAEGG